MTDAATAIMQWDDPDADRSLPAWTRTVPSLRSAALSAMDWLATEIDSLARTTVLGSMA